MLKAKMLSEVEVEEKDLLKHQRRIVGSTDTVVFFESEQDENTYYMLSENFSYQYIGMTVILNDKVDSEVFFHSEDALQGLKASLGFDWAMSPFEKTEILLHAFY